MKIPFSEETLKNVTDRFPEYLSFGEVVDNNPKITEIARVILSMDDEEVDLLVNLRCWLNTRAYDENKKPIHRAKNILESRLTPASQLIDLHMASCGSLATLGASILRNLGVPVKLIHGSYPGVDNHAWVEVYFPDRDEWVSLDFTGKGRKNSGQITSNHHKIRESADWSEIKSMLTQENERYLKRGENQPYPRQDSNL